MAAHTKEEFNLFLSQLSETNATLDFYCDFKKIIKNTEKIDIRLNQLNYLIGKENFEQAVYNLWNENPKVFDPTVMQILIAVRNKDKRGIMDDDGRFKPLRLFFDSPQSVIEYLENTGLKNIFVNSYISNLHDYVFGVETGLDTNARKNRSGDITEDRVENLFITNGIQYRKEVYSDEWEDLKCLGEDRKRFDFVVSKGRKTFLIEVNFYSGGGSKLNEVARSYTEIGPKINALDNFEFVWITDGKGWNKAKNMLEEAFYSIPRIYNFKTIKDFIAELKNK